MGLVAKTTPAGRALERLPGVKQAEVKLDTGQAREATPKP